MELTKNKLIFFIVGGIVFFLLFVMLLIMFLSGNKTRNSSTMTNQDFLIWTVGDNGVDTNAFLEDFKKFSGVKSGVILQSFENFEEYSLALTYAISSGNAPDVFVLNNNEKNPLFEKQIVGISPEVVNPDFFRKNYKTFITDQLISTTENGAEFLTGLPVGYETLGIFYNKKFVKDADLSDFSSLNSVISKLKERNPEMIPLAIGNGTTVPFSEDILTQFLLSKSGEKSISNLSKENIKNGLTNYFIFGDTSFENAYNSRFEEMKVANETGVELFSKGEAFMTVGYPRLINKITFSPNLLFAKVFPSESGVALVNYNYFVINKNTNKIDIADKFMAYLSSEFGAKKYFETFPYYIPAINVFEENMSEQKINSKYNIKISDFYDDSLNYTSFDKGIKIIYDSKIREILDDIVNGNDKILNLQKYINCVKNKVVNQADFGKTCN